MRTGVPAVPTTFFRRFVDHETARVLAANRKTERATAVSVETIRDEGIGVVDTLRAATTRWCALKSLAVDARFAEWFNSAGPTPELIDFAATHPLRGELFDSEIFLAALQQTKKNPAD